MHYAPIAYLPWLFLTVWYYRTRRKDIVPLVASALSCIAVLTAGLISGMFGKKYLDVTSFFVIGAVVAAMTAAAAIWLRHTSSKWAKARGVGDA